MKNFFKKLFNKIKSIRTMLSFEEGVDISDDFQVLKRRNIVIKNVIFFTNIVYTVILFVVSLIAGGTSNWVITIAFFPVTYGINTLLKKFIYDDSKEMYRQEIAMYIAAFYLFLSGLLIYFKLKTLTVEIPSMTEGIFNLGEAGYIFVYFTLLVTSMYQNSKMLKNVCITTLIIETLVHFLLTYNIASSQGATAGLFDFVSSFFSSSECLDIALRTILLILYMIVLFANVRIGEYVSKERKKELVKRQDVQTDYSDVVSGLFDVILGMKSTNQNDIEHIEVVSKIADNLANSLHFEMEEMVELKKYIKIHIEERKNLQIIKKDHMSEEDFQEVRRRSEIGAIVARRLQLEEKCEDIIRTHIEGAPTRSFKNEMNNMLVDKQSQVILICDCYVTMREAKSYKRPYSHKLAVDFINHELIDYFDEEIFEKFMKNVNTYESFYNESI